VEDLAPLSGSAMVSPTDPTGAVVRAYLAGDSLRSIAAAANLGSYQPRQLPDVEAPKLPDRRSRRDGTVKVIETALFLDCRGPAKASCPRAGHVLVAALFFVFPSLAMQGT
jgi:hypothetical protein